MSIKRCLVDAFITLCYLFKSITMFGKGADKTAAEFLEAHETERKGDNCVSQTSVYLRKIYPTFLSTCWRDDGLVLYFGVFVSLSVQLKFGALPVRSFLRLCVFCPLLAVCYYGPARLRRLIDSYVAICSLLYGVVFFFSILLDMAISYDPNMTRTVHCCR